MALGSRISPYSRPPARGPPEQSGARLELTRGNKKANRVKQMSPVNQVDLI